MTDADAGPKARFLVLHDYGMGGVWWWVRARSAREVRETFAEVEVVTRPEAVRQAETWDVAEVDIDAPTMPDGLADLRSRRDGQRDRDGFGVLADKGVVYVRRRWDEADDDEPTTYLMEIGPDGRRLRQVELAEDGTALKSGPGDWLFNPSLDLFDPQLADAEISRDEFETQWARARREEAEW